MTQTSQISLLQTQEQFRMRRLQVFNWGTFSGIHDITITERGFLFIGRSGAGKSTLLDAFSTLLIPPRWIDFNAAAREADRSGRDRNLITYMRGAWAEQDDEESGHIVTRYLRSQTTWSALALTDQNKQNQAVTLVQVFWVRGNTNNNAEVKRLYILLERPFDLKELDHFGQSNFDVRKLKQTLTEAHIYDEFRPYCERFCRLFGIENDMALRLLHKTQSAKNLGDLNTFLREFMLDKPDTFDVADRMVHEFNELDTAYQVVIRARNQISTLKPVREQHQQMHAWQIQRTSLEELQSGISNYRELRRTHLLKHVIAELTTKKSGVADEVRQAELLREQHAEQLMRLEQQHREQGGDRIEQWNIEKKDLESQRDLCLRKQNQTRDTCQQLGWILPDNPRGLAELVANARQEVEAWEQRSNHSREKQFQLADDKKKNEHAFIQAKKEIQALRQQPSNIPANMLELRREITTALGIAETALPFVGELIEVKKEESEWQGAIERVLHGFALSLLVDERHYAALTTHLNGTDLLRRRIVYYRTGRTEHYDTKPLATSSLILKLNIKENPQTIWLRHELRQRFDYACVDSMQAFRSADRALTKEGQIKHNKARHEKDDRHAVSDRRMWVLGFDNREKLAIFEKQAQTLAEVIAQLTDSLNNLDHQDKKLTQRAFQCQALINLQWQEIDLAPLLTRIDHIDQALKNALHSASSTLQQLTMRVAKQKQHLDAANQKLTQASVEFEELRKQIKQCEITLETLLKDPTIVPLTPHQQSGLDQRFDQLEITINLNNLDKATTNVVQTMAEESKTLDKQINMSIKVIENHLGHFIREWPAESGGLDASIEAVPDFLSKLIRLETDGLPAHEERFFELLHKQGKQNLAALSTHFDNARKDILDRMEMVNASLCEAPFNKTIDQRTYLRIDVSDKHLADVREFKQLLHDTLAHAWNNDDKVLEEARFINLRKLVTRLASQETEARHWRNLVLDVRQHVEFIGREIDEDGVEIEVHRSGAGKSGGQRQKFATTCLAAALRYQLTGNNHKIPLYAPVILDEAFDKADNEFTALAMNIFVNLGFQMIVATPLKSVMTLEPFIGGACFVDISDRRVSGVLLIEYNESEQRLNLPSQTPLEVTDAIS